MRKQTIIGFIIVIIGVNILFDAMNISTGSFVAPLIFFVIGMFFYQRKHTFLSMFFFIVSASIFFDQILGMNLIGLLIAFVALYYGIRLVRSPNKKKEQKVKRKKRRKKEKAKEGIQPVEIKDQEIEEEIKLPLSSKEPLDYDNVEREFLKPLIRRNWIGDIHYTGEAFELNDLMIWNGIGDVRLDLTKAMIPEGETVIIVQGMICQINFFVPDDLAVTIVASSFVGEVSLFHEKQDGLNQQLSVATKGYKQAPRRVKLVLSSVIGEVKVRAV